MYVIPQTLVGIDCIVLKLIQPLQDLTHFFHSLLFLLIFLSYQVTSLFLVFLVLAYIHLLFLKTNLLLIYCCKYKFED